MSELHPFILIVGPTASGKSALGLDLAKRFGGAILNCDSLQSYVRLDIGTAKPTLTERAQVPHFLFDYIEPANVLTAGDFRRSALEVLARELPRRPVFGVGGSGFYIQALEKGMFDAPKPKPEVERAVRARVEEKGLAAAYAELSALDSERAGQLNPNDAYRITRALILIHDTGKRASDIQKEFARTVFPYPLIKFGLDADRAVLEPRIKDRTERMLAQGLVQEVRRLMSDHLENWAPLDSVGYKECKQFLRGEISEAKLAPLICEKTLQLAKKQRTWFKRDPEIKWLGQDNLNEALAILARQLTSRPTST